MSTRFSHVAVLVASLAISSATAETIELVSGEVLIGRVLEITPETLQMEVLWPEQEEREIPTGDVTAESLYTTMAIHSDPEDPDARERLAQTCVRLDLPAHAVAEFREAARLDPSRAEACDEKIMEVVENLAKSLKQEAADHMAAGRYSAAELILDVLVNRFKRSATAQGCAPLLQAAREKLRAAQEGVPVPNARLREQLRTAQALEARADELGVEGIEPYSNSVLHLRRVGDVVTHLQRAWNQLAGYAPREEDPELLDELLVTRERIRSKLVDRLLLEGTIQVRAHALLQAEDRNQRAHALAPDDPRCRELQDLIVRARMAREGSDRAP